MACAAKAILANGSAHTIAVVAVVAVLSAGCADAPSSPEPSTVQSPSPDGSDMTSKAVLTWAAPVSLGSGFPTVVTSSQGAWVGLESSASQVIGWRLTGDGDWVTQPVVGFGQFVPTALVSFRDRLIASAINPSDPASSAMFVSDDGARWTAIESAALNHGTIRSVVAGPQGALAIGIDSGRAATWSSSDIDDWAFSAIDSPTGAVRLLTAATTSGGFVVAGLTGTDLDNAGGFKLEKPSTPAAWFSTDGISWQASAVEAIEAKGAHIQQVIATANVLLAIGSDPMVDPDVASSLQVAWRSTDGRAWQRVGEVGIEIPSGMLAITNDVLLVLGGGDLDPGSGGHLGGWLSGDALDWRPVAFAGSPDIPYAPGAQPLQPILDNILSGDVGLLVFGVGDEGERSWVATLSPLR